MSWKPAPAGIAGGIEEGGDPGDPVGLDQDREQDHGADARRRAARGRAAAPRRRAAASRSRGRSPARCRGRRPRPAKSPAPTTPSTGIISPIPPALTRGRVASSWAANRTSASFISSEGWTWIGPAAIQAREPFTSRPIPGTSTARQRTKATASRAGVSGRSGPDAAAGEQVHQHQPDGAEHERALEVVGAVTGLAQQRRRRAGAEHHHRAEGEQAEGRGEQQRVLERVRASAARGAHRRPPTRARKCSPRASKSG